MAPPELPRDAPVLDVLQPLVVDLGPLLGHEACLAARRGLQSRLRHAVHAHEPLVGEHRLDHRLGALRARHHQLVRLGALDEAGLFEVREDALARHEPVEGAIGGRSVFVQLRFERENLDRNELVAHPHLVVVEIVRRGDLHHSGAEFAVHVGVRDDGNEAIGQRKANLAADKVLVAIVLGMHRDRRVPQHRLGARGGDDQMAAAVLERITQVPERAVLVARLDLEVGHRRLQHRVPVHQALAAIDEPLVEEAHEHLGHAARELLVHREVLARPVARGAQPAHLARDGGARLLLPRPHALHELLAPQGAARFADSFELALHHHLGRDAGVVGARLPQHVVALHAVIAREHVHQRLLVRVPHVQRAGHVGGRQLDGERGPRGVEARLEVAARFPQGVPARLDVVGIEALGEFHGARRRHRIDSRPAPSGESGRYFT